MDCKMMNLKNLGFKNANWAQLGISFNLYVYPYHSNYFLHPYLDMGLTGVCR